MKGLNQATFALFLIALGCGYTPAAHALRYRVVCADCGVRRAADDNGLVAINSSGEMAGQANGHAAIYLRRHRTDLGTFGGPTSLALGVNGPGVAIGEATYPDVAETSHAFMWQAGQLTDLGVLYPGADDYSSATGINDQGQIVGVSRTAGDTQHSAITHCVVTSATPGAVMQDLGLPPDAPPRANCADPSINRLGHVALTMGPETWYSRYGYLLADGQWTALGTLDTVYPNSYAEGMNDLDQVVGWSSSNAFLWTNGTMQNLGTLPGGEAMGAGAYAVNNLGHVVGISGIDPAVKKRFYVAGFIYKDHRMIDLNTLLDFFSSLQWYVEDAVSINDGDEIAAIAYSKGVPHNVLLTPVP